MRRAQLSKRMHPQERHRSHSWTLSSNSKPVATSSKLPRLCSTSIWCTSWRGLSLTSPSSASPGFDQNSFFTTKGRGAEDASERNASIDRAARWPSAIASMTTVGPSSAASPPA